MQQGASTLGWFLIIPWFLGLGLLYAFGGGTFESIVTFGIIGIWSLSVSLFAYSKGIKPFEWMGRFDKSDAGYLVIGIVGLLASVYLTTAIIPGNEGILTALFLGGIVLAVVLIKSQNILVPIGSHAIYNFIVVMIVAVGAPGTTVPLANTPFSPTFEFGALTSQDTFIQLVLQIIVGSAEELLKVGVALGIYIMLARNVAVAWVLSIAAWTFLHAVQSYVIELNLASLLGG